MPTELSRHCEQSSVISGCVGSASGVPLDPAGDIRRLAGGFATTNGESRDFELLGFGKTVPVVTPPGKRDEFLVELASVLCAIDGEIAKEEGEPGTAVHSEAASCGR